MGPQVSLQVAAVAVDPAADVALGLPPMLRLVLGETGRIPEAYAAHRANVDGRLCRWQHRLSARCQDGRSDRRRRGGGPQVGDPA